MAINEVLFPAEKEAAKERQGERTDQHRGKFPQSTKGKSRDKVARYVGVSGRTLEKATLAVRPRSQGQMPL